MSVCLLSVAAGTAQAPLIRDMADSGVSVAAMDQNATAAGFDFAQQAYVADIMDEQEIIRVARDCHAKGIVCISCDAALPAVVNACKVLKLPSLTPEMVAISTSKRLQRQALTCAKLSTPWYCVITESSDLARIENSRSGVRVVVKPADSSGSRGVCLVEADDSLDRAVAEALIHSPSCEVLVESYLVGTEYSVEAWVSSGEVHILACSEKVRTEPPYLLDREVHFPPELPVDSIRELEEQARLAIIACGYDNCPVHVECIMNNGSPIIVELAARGAGFRVFSEILSLVSGVDISSACIDTALGRSPDLKPKHRPKAASLKFIDPVPGRLMEVRGLQEARQVEGVAEVMVYAKPGDLLNELRSGTDRAGHVIAYASTSDECRFAAVQATEKIQLLTDQSNRAAA